MTQETTPSGMRPDFAAVPAGDAVVVPTEQWDACFEAMSVLRCALALGDLRGGLAAETERLVALFNSKIKDATDG